ncbi:hypothetical protein O181_101615 [Austropuccinia psidii MF-1]|uniref:Chromo domain-containing protein n=1 Tax=Austropuccinia psidii MF-1 TaxID=1389203 RepID=A0A9Q3JET1_9BASI|nr:hypothetical protein [Austropuccinia psidii MF-1]
MRKLSITFTYSKRLSPPLQSFYTQHSELNYEIHDKELLGIVCALKCWRALLLSLSSPFEVLSNTLFIQKCLITSGQHLSGEGGGFHQQESNDFQHLIKQDEFQPSVYFAVKVEPFSNFIESIQEKLWQEPQYRSILQELGKLKSVQDYSLDSSSQLLLFKDCVVVPNDPTIQLSILQQRHDSPLAGHPSQEKTLKLVKRDLHWSRMTQFIKEYVPSCQQCSRNKNIHHKKFGLLKPLPIPNGPWSCFSMDFITQLPLSNSFDSILVIVDRFPRMAVFIPTMSSITSLDLDHLLIKNIFSKHGLPSSIQPETDGQTERINHILEQYLQIDPQFDSVHITPDNLAGTLSTKIQSVQQDVKRELEASINRFKRFSDKSRATPPDFIPGHMVWLSSKNIKATRPTKKLSERWLGPFPILQKFSTHSYHLKLPSQWKSFHPVFDISLLKPVKTSTIPNWHQKAPPPIIIEEEEEWEVSQILDSNIKRGKALYLVEWKGFSKDSERSTWEPTENLKNCPELVEDFHSLYPEKPGTNSSKPCFFMGLPCHWPNWPSHLIWPFMAISSSGPTLGPSPSSGLFWPFSTFGQFWYFPVNRGNTVQEAVFGFKYSFCAFAHFCAFCTFAHFLHILRTLRKYSFKTV